MPDWDLSGRRARICKVLSRVGYRVAQADRFPEWKPGNEFRAVREARGDGRSAYTEEVNAWRAKHEADYTRDYVPLAGLFFLKPGANTVGSAPTSDVVLPERAPASIGRFVYENQQVRFEPASGVAVMLKGKPVTSPVELHSDETSGYDELSLETLPSGYTRAATAGPSASRSTGRACAKHSPASSGSPLTLVPRGRQVHQGCPAARVESRRALPADDQAYTTEGVVEFTLKGETIRIRPMTTRPSRFYLHLP